MDRRVRNDASHRPGRQVCRAGQPIPATSVKTPVLQRAISFAARAHHGQFRKDGRTPYAAHPIRAAFTLQHLFGVRDESVLAAAVLHDTIEDTTTDYDELEREFGPQIAGLVACLTKDDRLPEDHREKLFDERLAAAPWQARLIKLADAYDNLLDSATSPRMASRALDRARRALALAGDHIPEIANAKTALVDLIEGQE